jgi:hypothetical protein
VIGRPAAGSQPGQAPRPRPRLIAPGVGRRPVLTLAGRLLATMLHQGLSLPGPHLLASLDDLYSLATAEGITVPPEIKAGR